jgi:thiamine pyrophosphokinase
MDSPIIASEGGITLAGGAPFGAALLREALGYAPRLVAADGGADRLLRLGHVPEIAIGDFDSISAAARETLGADRLHHIPEQDTTDFDKALRSVTAPFVLGLGFTGARIDHGLAVLNALGRHSGRRVLLVGPRDVTFLAPAELALRLPVGTRLSLFPLAEVRGESVGLHWPIGGVDFHPRGLIGTSNRVSMPEVRLSFDRPGMLVILPRARLGAAVAALAPAPAPR